MTNHSRTNPNLNISPDPNPSTTRPASIRGRRRPARRARSFRVEPLAGRAMGWVGGASPPFLANVPIDTIIGGASPAGTSPPAGASPAQIRHAYGFDSISFNGGLKGDGTGQTIAIVNAFNQPNIKADLHTFDQQFGLPDPPSFQVVGQDGSANLPADASTNNWGVEISMDVEWAHALAPGASLLLVEAASASTDLYTAVAYAAAQPGVSVVSMSWGSAEFAGEQRLRPVLPHPRRPHRRHLPRRHRRRRLPRRLPGRLPQRPGRRRDLVPDRPRRPGRLRGRGRLERQRRRREPL